MTDGSTARGGTDQRTDALPPMRRRLGWVIGILTTIAVLVVIRRGFALLLPPAAGAPAGPIPDEPFAAHRLLTLAHILPGLAFLALAPVQFSSQLRAKRPALHRELGRTVLLAGVATFPTPFAMSPEFNAASANERAPTATFPQLLL